MIVLINGSPRKDGSTSAVLKYISDRLREKGAATEIIHTADLHLQYCTGCCKCYETGKCIYADDIENLSHKLEKADGIVIGSPTYAGNISGQLKTIIDRGHFVIEQLLYRKYAMSVVTYENYGGKEVSKILNKLMFCSGANISPSLTVKNPFSHNPLTNRKAKNNITEKTEIFYKNLSGQKRPVCQSVKHFLVFHFGILPFVIKKGKAYRAVTDRWKEKEIPVKKKDFFHLNIDNLFF